MTHLGAGVVRELPNIREPVWRCRCLQVACPVYLHTAPSLLRLKLRIDELVEQPGDTMLGVRSLLGAFLCHAPTVTPSGAYLSKGVSRCLAWTRGRPSRSPSRARAGY